MTSRQSTNQDRHEPRKQEKLAARKDAAMKHRFTKAAARTLGAAAALGAVGGLVWFASTRPNLPPTIVQGHTEDMPATHITDRPLPDGTQRHMLEHADGRGKPGVIVQYNCKKYSCASDLVAKLTDLIKQYPDNVYLAPGEYDGKIILTKLDALQVLGGFDEQAIAKFIGT